jgi:hypothetical protein
MVELRKYATRLNDAIGKKYPPTGKNSADVINEGHWLEAVIVELHKMSLDCARELEPEIGRLKGKEGFPDGQPSELSPPPRLLALNLILSYWLGWVMAEKHGDSPPVSAWNRIEKAYKAGQELSENNEVP